MDALSLSSMSASYERSPCLSELYESYAEMPELAIFPRNIPIMTWMLHGKVARVETLEKQCDSIVAKAYGNKEDGSPLRLIDICREWIAADDGEGLDRSVVALEEAIHERTDFALKLHAVANLPPARKVYTRHHTRFDDLFRGGVYEPTNEQAEKYLQDPAHPDLFSLKESNRHAQIPEFVFDNVDTVIGWLRKRMNSVLGRPSDVKSQHQEWYYLSSIRIVWDLGTAVYAAVLFAGSLGVLSCLESERLRIVVLGAFSLLLSLSLLFLAPTLKRSELIAIQVGYFAVGGIYIGARVVVPTMLGA